MKQVVAQVFKEKSYKLLSIYNLFDLCVCFITEKFLVKQATAYQKDVLPCETLELKSTEGSVSPGLDKFQQCANFPTAYCSPRNCHLVKRIEKIMNRLLKPLNNNI